MIVVAQIEYILRRELHVPARRAVHIKALEERLKMDGVAVWWLKIGVDNAHMTVQKRRDDDDLDLDCVSVVHCDGVVGSRHSHRRHGQQQGYVRA